MLIFNTAFETKEVNHGKDFQITAIDTGEDFKAV